MSYNLLSGAKKWNSSSLMWIAGVLVLILLSGMVIVACEDAPGINGNGSNNGQYNNDNNKNKSCNGVNNCNTINSSSSGSSSTSAGGYSGVSSNQQQCPSFQRENLGLWVYNGSRPPFPHAPSDCQVIVAHGDIGDSATCHIKVFHAHEPVGNLGSGTFRLLRITGSPEQIQHEINSIQQGLGGANVCPYL